MRPRIHGTSSVGGITPAQGQHFEGYTLNALSTAASNLQYQPSDVPSPPPPTNSQEDESTSIRAAYVPPRIAESQGVDAIRSHEDDSQDRESDPGSDDSPAFLGSSSAFGFMTEVRRALHPTNAHPGSNCHVSPGAFFRSKPSWLGSFELEGHYLNLSPPGFVSPPRHTADMLLNSYWSRAHPLVPFIHRPSFMKRFDPVSRSSPSELSLLCSHFKFLTSIFL